MTVIPAEGAILDDVLETMCRTVHGGLNRQAYGRFHAARKKTTWGSRGQRLFALVEGVDVLASAAQYDLTGVFEGRPTRSAALARCARNCHSVISATRVC
jgi:hypothetical protein